MTLLTGRIGRAALVACGLFLGSLPAVHAQTKDDPFIVAVPEVYPASDGYGFIVRGSGADRKDVIIMNRALLDARTLVAAVALLQRLRAGSPVPAGATEITTVQGFASWRGREPREVAAIGRLLARLAAAPRVRIGNVGPGRWLELQPDILRR